MVLSYVSGALAQPHVYFTESTNRASTWSTSISSNTGPVSLRRAGPVLAVTPLMDYLAANRRLTSPAIGSFLL